MARNFSLAGPQYLGDPAISALSYPFSFCAWIKPAAVTSATRRTIFWILDAADDNKDYQMQLQADGTVFLMAYNNGVLSSASSVGLVTAGVWQFIAAVFTSATSRTVYLGAVGANSDATNVTGINATLTTIGAVYQQAGPVHSQGFDGDIAYAAIYNKALDTTDINSLATNRLSPLVVSAGSLAHLWILPGTVSPELDSVGGVSITNHSTTRASTDPDIVGTIIWEPSYPDLMPDTEWDAVDSGFTPRSPADPTNPTPN